MNIEESVVNDDKNLLFPYASARVGFTFNFQSQLRTICMVFVSNYKYSCYFIKCVILIK